MKTQKVTHQSYLPSNNKSKLVFRRTRKRFNPRIIIDRTIETTAIVSLLITGFSGVGAMGCWGIEIATSSHYWQQQKSICLGAMLVSFSAFLGTSLVGASLSIQRDKF
ncbi:hypothetical protein COO91_09445 (plasmid) [Nostoc flagelliforme CCNUN1]|uniref:Uncharacterized protein n=1 Tax=Nostoc flagelliforme CCNUN1 TaxID=2038116 RepID=A0A2K8T6F8_9NOSO|nr:hypothetical protein [Nostoc flagelliforme]AUB43272.1 hypothetical protein COO91_09445 [Nostoc flagelliforme CCNUN1]